MHKPPVAYVLEDQRRMGGAKNYLAWQSRKVLAELAGKRRVVEVGCGVGNFTRNLLDRELVIALDIEPECVDRLRHRYPEQPNLQTLVSEPGEPAFAKLAGHEADCCVCMNVLEHIEDDLQALIAMRSILVAGGRAVLIVPAFQILYGPIDRNLGHYRRYDRKGFGRLAAEAGWAVKKLQYMNAVGSVGWWMNAHILKKEAQSERQIAVFDRYLMPLISAFESLVSPPFGQSLFAVLEKE
jgi:SAM-dependent methyltransferase